VKEKKDVRLRDMFRGLGVVGLCALCVAIVVDLLIGSWPTITITAVLVIFFLAIMLVNTHAAEAYKETGNVWWNICRIVTDFVHGSIVGAVCGLVVDYALIRQGIIIWPWGTIAVAVIGGFLWVIIR